MNNSISSESCSLTDQDKKDDINNTNSSALPNDRFQRVQRLIGSDKFKRLTQAKITLIGLGAVGGYCLEGLLRSGLRNVRVVDFDILHISNINRQILATDASLGRSKARVAEDRARSINPDVQLEVLDLFAHQETFPRIFDNNPDIVIDAIDSFTPKTLLLEYAWRNGYQVFSSMGAATRLVPELIKVDDLMDTTVCPLAKLVRKRLRRLGVGRGIRAVYSLEQSDQPETNNCSAVAPYDEVFTVDASVNHPDNYCDTSTNKSMPKTPEHASDEGVEYVRGRRRTTLGSIGTITGIFGLRLAHEVITTIISDNNFANNS